VRAYTGKRIKNLSTIFVLNSVSTAHRYFAFAIVLFPENFIWIGTKTEKEQMIGNAVPVKLAEFVGQCIEEFVNSDHHPTKQLNLF